MVDCGRHRVFIMKYLYAVDTSMRIREGGVRTENLRRVAVITANLITRSKENLMNSMKHVNTETTGKKNRLMLMKQLRKIHTMKDLQGKSNIKRNAGREKTLKIPEIQGILKRRREIEMIGMTDRGN